MFRFESYVAPILLSYIDKYVRDFKPEDAQVSLWGGGVALHNLVLKTDVLQKELSLPFSLVSGRIHELLIQVPWTKIMSEPIVVSIDTIECVLGVNPLSSTELSESDKSRVKSQVVEAPPGYMQAVIRRIVSNISLKIHHLIVKYVQDDIVLSLNVKHLSLNSSDCNWESAFADIDQNVPVLRKIVHLDDLTLCLDRADADGKIRFYHEPILYRCRLDLRICIRLVSANTRRASSLAAQVHSSRLVWGITSEQLVLVMRMCRELNAHRSNEATTKLSAPMNAQPAPSVSGELSHQDSWSHWAWSWLPSWDTDSSSHVADEGGPGPLPVAVSVKIDAISLVFKIMESDSGNRKRVRNVLEFNANHTIMKASIAAPTDTKVQLGIRTLLLTSTGKCVCMHVDRATLNDEPTVYLEPINPPEDDWDWPEDNFFKEIVDPMILEEERSRLTKISEDLKSFHSKTGTIDSAQAEEPSQQALSYDTFWEKMQPQIYVEFEHQRCPPTDNVNPYENPPKDFQYSDWIEDCCTKVTVLPIAIRSCTGLIHRIKALLEGLNELPPVSDIELPKPVLTVEENEALSENLPQRRITIEIQDLRITLIPWDHLPTERPNPILLYLDVDTPKLTILITGPLYPHRVCVAASQLPTDSGPLWQAARSHITGVAHALSVAIRSLENESKTCARVDLKFVTHVLLNKSYFDDLTRETVDFSYTLKIKEINICGSAARLHTVFQIFLGIIQEKQSSLIQETSIVKDAFANDNAVALDFTLEDISLRGYITKNTYTHTFSLLSAKCTVLQAPERGEPKQAWLFSAPDTKSTTPFLRLAVQWCKERTPRSLEYIGVWTEPVAICFDALFAAWLAYKPFLRVSPETQPDTPCSIKRTSSTKFDRKFERRFTPPSSSGRGASKTGSATELIHTKPKSGESSSGKSEARTDTSKLKKKVKTSLMNVESLVNLQNRLRRALVHFDMGVVEIYVPPVPTTAVNTATVRDAMELHALNVSNVSVISLGRVNLHSSSTSKSQWQDVRNDGPTILSEIPRDKTDSFPFKMKIADVTWYLMEPNTNTDGERPGQTLRSNLKSRPVLIKTILDPVTTSFTLSVVTKCAQSKKESKKSISLEASPKKKHEEDEKTKYYSSGLNFHPTTFKEFLRGPRSRKETASSTVHEDVPSKSGLRALVTGNRSVETRQTGPVVSVGVHLHIDTPPILVRLDRSHVAVMAKSIHCLNHIITLMKDTAYIPRQHSFTNLNTSKIGKGADPMQDTNSESGDIERSESGLIAIFEFNAGQNDLKVFFWFQWVVSRVSVVITTDFVKLGFDMEDIIGTVDLQQYYNQFKIKVSSVGIKHQHKSSSEEWHSGVLGGRILEVREQASMKDDNNFLTVTVTQAWISNLPESWKGVLHPKLLQHKKDSDEMWEIYATLAPLEIVLMPSTIRNLSTVLKQVLNQGLCPINNDISDRSSSEVDPPFCYVSSGGIRLILTDDPGDVRVGPTDDTFIFNIGKINLNPHPENPIIRRPVNPAQEVVWTGGTSIPDGIQYEIQIKSFSIRSTKFEQLIIYEATETAILKDGTSAENPAVKWTTHTSAPTTTPLLHSVDICCIFAPALYKMHVMTFGPAFEFNLVSDCDIEVSIIQLSLANKISESIRRNITKSQADFKTMSKRKEWELCPFSHILLKRLEETLTTPMCSDDTLVDDDPVTQTIDLEVEYEADVDFGKRKESERIKPDFDTGNDAQRSALADSGYDTYRSRSTLKPGSKSQEPLRKSVSVAFLERSNDPLDYLEVYVTTGKIEISFYTLSDVEQDNTATTNEQNEQDSYEEVKSSDTDGVKSITAVNREIPGGIKKGHMLLAQTAAVPKGIVPLFNLMLKQPNFYYWRRRQQQSLQASLHDAWIRLGGDENINWNYTILSTAQGPLDPSTDIPPSLVTISISDPAAPLSSGKGAIKVDFERPVLIEVDCYRLKSLLSFIKLLKAQIVSDKSDFEVEESAEKGPPLYKLRKYLVLQSVESFTLNTTQISVSGPEGAISFDTMNFQVSTPLRLEKIIARGLITAFSIVTGSPQDCRRLVLQPCTFGTELVAKWDAWKKTQEGLSTTDPVYHVCVDIDTISIDVRPNDFLILQTLKQGIEEVLETTIDSQSCESEDSNNFKSGCKLQAPSIGTIGEDLYSHFYQDDLRSGAFKIVQGAKMPQVYQIAIHEDCVAWQYPQPRAIARLLTLPILYEDEPVACILEVYIPLIRSWEPHTYFEIPTHEPKEYNIFTSMPFDAVFAKTWRFRVCTESDKKPKQSYEFDFNKFMPKKEQVPTENNEFYVHGSGKNMAQDLISAVKVDSYFAMHGITTAKMSIRCVSTDIYLHNDLPAVNSQSKYLEGYYVTKPLMRAHRVLRISFGDSAVHARLNSHILVNTTISSEIFDCAKGTMECFVSKFNIQGAIATRSSIMGPRARLRTSVIRIALNVTRLRTIESFVNDWINAYKKHIERDEKSDEEFDPADPNSKKSIAEMEKRLEGRVSLWVYNSTVFPMRLGQEGTDEVIPLGPNSRLAYRWHSPSAPKKLHFALIGPISDWGWSASVPFVVGKYRVRLEEESPGTSTKGNSNGPFMHIIVEEEGARMHMTLFGRLTLVNLLRIPLQYKIRLRYPEPGSQWRTIISGELEPECFGRSVLCNSDAEMLLKIKFVSSVDSGWSGDIPIKECPKENMPWLVKVPNESQVPYVSVWCRVVRGRSDGRLLAAIWPLYILRSYLPLHTDVLITSEACAGSSTTETNIIPYLQAAKGRGHVTHIYAPGTTSVRHSLTFQYTEVDYAVTREAVPLHYGVTDTSVFMKHSPPQFVNDVIADINAWLKNSNSKAKPEWPFSLVLKHCREPIEPARLQPRSNVTVRYVAVRAGGGCSLEMRLCPLALLVNASPLVLTLRAHDAAPLCKVEPYMCLSPPHAAIKKPFFISIEQSRDTYVSRELAVWDGEPGAYGQVPPGCVAIDKHTNFAILCNQKIALLTMYYEIKEDINVLGVSSTHVVINRLGTDLLVAGIAVPSDMPNNMTLHPIEYTTVPPVEDENDVIGSPLCQLLVHGRLRGNDPPDYRSYICLRLPPEDAETLVSVPVRIGRPPVRRPVALRTDDGKAVPVVVTQVISEGRWIITVAPDPCPQFVLHNKTQFALKIAQPVKDTDSAKVTETATECEGVRWWCFVQPKEEVHYSTPMHCWRYPPCQPCQVAEVPFLCLADVLDESSEPNFSMGVAAAAGEQLIQLRSGATVKMRVRTRPHSTFVTFRDVNQFDLSASDIRKRLIMNGQNTVSLESQMLQSQLNYQQLKRTGAVDKLFHTPASNTAPSESEAEKAAHSLDAAGSGNNAGSTEPAIASSSRAVQSSVIDHYTTSILPDYKEQLRRKHIPDPSIDQKHLHVTPRMNKRISRVSLANAVDYFKAAKSDKIELDLDNISAATLEYDMNTIQTVIDEDMISSVFSTHADEFRRLSLSFPQAAKYGLIDTQVMLREISLNEWRDSPFPLSQLERSRCVISGIIIELASSAETKPLLALYIDRAALLLASDNMQTRATITVADIQVDNLLYNSGQHDFAVIATTRDEPLEEEPWPPLWNMFAETESFSTRQDGARLLVKICFDKWQGLDAVYKEMTELDIKLGPLALYIEDAYVKAVLDLLKLACPAPLVEMPAVAVESRTLQRPLRFRSLAIQPLDLTLTLHTAVRMYIALDQSPLRLSAFRVTDTMTSVERLTHALTVHYLSAAILGAGWVVGGLELLGAPGALAARVGGASGGVRGVASAAAAALLRSLSAWAGSLARNLDLLAGDEEHAKRAAAARRRPPESFIEGLGVGITNFAVNLLGAVGGLAHHPLVGVAVGETESGVAALRRGLVGAFTKPLSATADLVAYAGHGLLAQAGWNPVPQPRACPSDGDGSKDGWSRDCVRWAFRLGETSAIAGYDVLVDRMPVRLLITHKFIVVTEPESEKILEMIDLRCCSVGKYEGPIIELQITVKKSKLNDGKGSEEEEEYKITAAAMARVARYTGAATASNAEGRVLSMLPASGCSLALYTTLTAAIHHASPVYLAVL